MNQSKLKILFSSFVYFYTMFFNWEGGDPTLIGWINNGLILAFAVLNFRSIRMLNVKDYRMINISAILLITIIVYSAYVNQDNSFDRSYWNVVSQSFGVTTLTAMRLDHTIYFVIKLLFFILYFEYLNRFNQGQIFFKYIFIFLFLFVLISDINGFVYESDGIDGYLAGNKFYVCYLNIFFVTIYLLRLGKKEMTKKQKMFVRIVLFITFLLSIKTKCTTMIIGTMVFYYLIFIFNKCKRFLLYKPYFYLSGLFIFDILFFLFVSWILQFSIVQYVIVDVLGEDLTLTGRVGMYSRLGHVLDECPLYGFGLGNSHMTTVMYGVGDNAQNGLLNLFIEIGILGTVFYFLMMLLLLVHAKNNKNSYSLICFVYMMLVVSSIEVTFTTYFTAMIILLILCFSINASNDKISKLNHFSLGHRRNIICY